MSRQYYVNGLAMVFVKGYPAGALDTGLNELGLSIDQITITINTKHKEVMVDDFGGIDGVPPELLWMGATATIDMTLIHFDHEILETVLAASMASTNEDNGTFAGIGTPMGGGRRLGPTAFAVNQGINIADPTVPQQHYLRLYIDYDDINELNAKPWQFPTSLMSGPPLIYPVGTKATAAVLRWKAIPYAIPSVNYTTNTFSKSNGSEIKSAGAVLWKRSFDD